MTVMDDWQRWQMASQGDAGCATALVRALTPQAYGLAFQLLRQAQDAEDVVQESFLRLWSSQPQSDRGASLSTFFNTIVINRCKTHLTRKRALNADHETLTGWADAQQMTQTDAAATDPLDGSTQAHLASAMHRLPPRQRMALAMWAYADADVPDIAKSLELEPNAAHQLLHRAKNHLRQLLTGALP